MKRKIELYDTDEFAIVSKALQKKRRKRVSIWSWFSRLFVWKVRPKACKKYRIFVPPVSKKVELIGYEKVEKEFNVRKKATRKLDMLPITDAFAIEPIEDFLEQRRA